MPRKTRRQQRGSALKGRGSYGCAFYPGLRCEGERRPTPYLSKYMDPFEADKEYKQLSLLNGIDPTQQFFLYPMDMCWPAKQTAEESAENPLHKCDQVQNGVVIQYMFGGESLYDFRPTAPQYAPFLESLGSLLKGLAVLHTGDVCHMDIKAANLVTQPLADGTFSTRFIDFGLSFNIRRFPASFPIDTYVLAQTDYFAWPYEVRFLYPGFKRGDITVASINSYYNACVDYGREYYPVDIYTDNANKSILTKDFITYMFDMYQFLSADDKTRHIAMASDIYALGRTLAMVYTTITGHSPGPNNSVFFQRLHDHDFRDTLFWTGQMEDAEYLWNREVAERVSVPFFDMCRSMMAPFPFNRLDAEELLRKFDQLLPAIRTLFQPDKVTMGLSLFFKTLRSTPMPPTPSTPSAP